MRRFNDRKIYEDADCVEIAEAIGMRMQKRGSSIFIECPEHEKNAGKRDTDLDRCIVSQKGYHCFSCGANGGVISMVRNFLGTSPYETRKTIATLLGSVNNYLEDGEYDPSKEQPYKKEQLLVTIDNGIKAIEPIAEAKRKGMKVIILDHHEAGAELPAADIIVDPKAVGEADYTEYCGAGIAYKLAEEILGKDHPIMKKLSCFAAIGTIGDSVEISEDNRKIVIDGLKNMKYGKGSEGLKMLLEAQKFSEGSTATDVAFNIVPVLNACGRLKDDGAKMGVVALIDGGLEKREKVNELLELNDLRKKLVEEAVSRLDLYAMAVSKDRSIFVVDNQIPLGIVGIVAGKISEYTGKPAFVLAKDETTGFYKGSARSKSNDYSLAGLMEAHAELFVGFGGHLKAAGLTMKEKNIMVFKNAIEKELPDVIFDDAIPYDIEVLEADFPMVAAQILSLEPFGEGNPAPVIRLQMTVDNYSIIGKNKDTLKFTGFGYEAIMFHAKEQISMLPKHVSVIDLIGKVGVNVFRGNITTQINITDFVVLR